MSWRKEKNCKKFEFKRQFYFGINGNASLTKDSNKITSISMAIFAIILDLKLSPKNTNDSNLSV